MSNLAKAYDVLIDKINQICNKFGLNNIMAQLYAVLYLSGEVLSLDDMSKRLKISKGSCSVNIRMLERYGAVRRVWVRGTRKDYYEAEADIVKVIMQRIKSMTQQRLSDAEEMIKSSAEILNSSLPADKKEDKAMKVFKERLAKLDAFRSQVLALFNLFNSGMIDRLLNNESNGERKEADLVASAKSNSNGVTVNI